MLTSAIILAAGGSKRIRHLTKTEPKCFLTVANQRLIDYSLEHLVAHGINVAYIVVGYLKEALFELYTETYKGIKLIYVVNDDYELKDHSWSLYLALQAWNAHSEQVLLLHADAYLEPQIVSDILGSNFDNILAVDSHRQSSNRHKILLEGTNGVVDGIKRDDSWNERTVGEVLGIHRLSKEFLRAYTEYSREYFISNSAWPPYEIILDEFIGHSKIALNYHEIGRDQLWANVNEECDLKQLRKTLTVYTGEEK
jgi:choline kinase